MPAAGDDLTSPRRFQWPRQATTRDCIRCTTFASWVFKLRSFISTILRSRVLSGLVVLRRVSSKIPGKLALERRVRRRGYLKSTPAQDLKGMLLWEIADNPKHLTSYDAKLLP